VSGERGIEVVTARCHGVLDLTVDGKPSHAIPADHMTVLADKYEGVATLVMLQGIVGLHVEFNMDELETLTKALFDTLCYLRDANPEVTSTE
jgi:hypothetical protein